MSSLYYLSLTLKVGMLIDALHRRAAFFWPLLILFLPGGELVYLAVVLAPELLPLRVRAPRERRQSVETLRHRLRENPCHAHQVQLADRLRETGERSEARELYGRLLAAEPDDRPALYGLALCHLDDGEPGPAIALLERLVSLRRSFADHAAWLRLGETLSAAGRHAEALDSLERLVQAAPRLPHQLALAQAQEAAGDPAAARRTLEAALEDYRHAPRFVRRDAREPARRASKLLGRLHAA